MAANDTLTEILRRVEEKVDRNADLIRGIDEQVEPRKEQPSDPPPDRPMTKAEADAYVALSKRRGMRFVVDPNTGDVFIEFTVPMANGMGVEYVRRPFKRD